WHVLPAAGRHLLLAAAFFRAHAVAASWQVGILAGVRRLQPDLSDHALDRPDGHAAADLYLPVRPGLGSAQPDFLGRQLHHGHRYRHGAAGYRAALSFRPEGVEQSLGCGYPRMGYAPAAQRLQLRQSTAGTHQPPDV